MFAVIRFSHNVKFCVMLYYDLHNSTRHPDLTRYRCEMKPKQNKISPSPHIATAVVSVGSPDYQNFTITDTSHSVRLLWTSDQPLAETST